MQSLPLANPFLEKLGVSLCVWREAYVEFRLALDPSLLNRTNRVQGGVICTLMDAACGYAGLFTLENEVPLQSVTLSLTTNFLNSASGSELVARGFVDRKGGSIYFARSEVWADDSLLVATATGTFKYLRPSAIQKE